MSNPTLLEEISIELNEISNKVNSKITELREKHNLSDSELRTVTMPNGLMFFSLNVDKLQS